MLSNSFVLLHRRQIPVARLRAFDHFHGELRNHADNLPVDQPVQVQGASSFGTAGLTHSERWSLGHGLL